jgi:hypothetical protein
MYTTERWSIDFLTSKYFAEVPYVEKKPEVGNCN